MESFFGDDIKKSIKKALDILMVKSVQKKLSWSGLRTTKPSFEMEYKRIVEAMKFALKSRYKDYSYNLFQNKIQTLLQGA